MSTGGKSKVANLDIVDAVRATADEDVLWLQVTVDDAESVNMSQTFQNLAEEAPDFGCVLIQVSRNEISKGLAVLVSKSVDLGGRKGEAYPFFTVLHRDV